MKMLIFLIIWCLTPFIFVAVAPSETVGQDLTAEETTWDLLLEYSERQEKVYFSLIFRDNLPDGSHFVVNLTRVIERPVALDWHFSALLHGQTGEKPINLTKDTTLGEIISLIRILRQREEDDDFVIFYNYDW